MGYAAQVKTQSDIEWAGNGLVFKTEKEAQDYVDDLMWRWTAVNQVRVIEVDKKATHRWVDDRVEKL